MDWSAEAFLRSSSSKEALWAKALERAINFEAEISEIRFTRIASKQYVGLALFLFVRHDLVGAVHDIGAASAACGVMGIVVRSLPAIISYPQDLS